MESAPESTNQQPVEPQSTQPQTTASPESVTQPVLDQASVTTEQQPPVTQETETPAIMPDEPKKGGKLHIFVFLFLLFLIGMALLTGGGVLVAYGKIEVKDPKLKKTISDIVFSIPFIPKTPEYVLQKSVLAHKDVVSATIDASLATNSNSIASLFNLQSFDMAFHGPVDLTDEEHPKFSLNIKLTSEFDMDMRVIDKDFYFRFNKIPFILTSYLKVLGRDVDFNPILNVWVHHQVEELDTEARRFLEEQKQEGQVFDEAYQKFVERVFGEKILPIVEMTDDEVDGFVTHKLSVDLVGELIDEIYEEFKEVQKQKRDYQVSPRYSETKPSDVIENIKVNLWIDKKTFYLRKMDVYMLVDTKSISKSSGTVHGAPFDESIEFVFSLKLANIGEQVSIPAPSDYMSSEEFVSKLMEMIGVGDILRSMPMTIEEFETSEFESLMQ